MGHRHPVLTAYGREPPGAVAWQTGHHVQWATLSSLQGQLARICGLQGSLEASCGPRTSLPCDVSTCTAI